MLRKKLIILSWLQLAKGIDPNMDLVLANSGMHLGADSSLDRRILTDRPNYTNVFGKDPELERNARAMKGYLMQFKQLNRPTTEEWLSIKNLAVSAIRGDCKSSDKLFESHVIPRGEYDRLLGRCGRTGIEHGVNNDLAALRIREKAGDSYAHANLEHLRQHHASGESQYAGMGDSLNVSHNHQFGDLGNNMNTGIGLSYGITAGDSSKGSLSSLFDEPMIKRGAFAVLGREFESLKGKLEATGTAFGQEAIERLNRLKQAAEAVVHEADGAAERFAEHQHENRKFAETMLTHTGLDEELRNALASGEIDEQIHAISVPLHQKEAQLAAMEAAGNGGVAGAGLLSMAEARAGSLAGEAAAELGAIAGTGATVAMNLPPVVNDLPTLNAIHSAELSAREAVLGKRITADVAARQAANLDLQRQAAIAAQRNISFNAQMDARLNAHRENGLDMAANAENARSMEVRAAIEHDLAMKAAVNAEIAEAAHKEMVHEIATHAGLSLDLMAHAGISNDILAHKEELEKELKTAHVQAELKKRKEVVLEVKRQEEEAETAGRVNDFARQTYDVALSTGAPEEDALAYSGQAKTLAMEFERGMAAGLGRSEAMDKAIHKTSNLTGRPVPEKVTEAFYKLYAQPYNQDQRALDVLATANRGGLCSIVRGAEKREHDRIRDAFGRVQVQPGSRGDRGEEGHSGGANRRGGAEDAGSRRTDPGSEADGTGQGTGGRGEKAD